MPHYGQGTEMNVRQRYSFLPVPSITPRSNFKFASLSEGACGRVFASIARVIVLTKFQAQKKPLVTALIAF